LQHQMSIGWKLGQAILVESKFKSCLWLGQIEFEKWQEFLFD
jgi:hypothetical protein